MAYNGEVSAIYTERNDDIKSPAMMTKRQKDLDVKKLFPFFLTRNRFHVFPQKFFLWTAEVRLFQKEAS